MLLYEETPQQNHTSSAEPADQTHLYGGSTRPRRPAGLFPSELFTLQVIVFRYSEAIRSCLLPVDSTAMSISTPGVNPGLNVQFGGALSIVKNVFSDLQTLAQFLPGGATARCRALRRFSHRLRYFHDRRYAAARARQPHQHQPGYRAERSDPATECKFHGRYWRPG